MGTFIIWLVIVALILLRSARQNKQGKAKNAKNTKGYTYPKTHPTESYPKSSPVSRKHSKPQEPKENVFTRAKRNVSEDFSKDKLSDPTEFSKDVPQNMDTKVTKTVTVPVADSSGNPAMNFVLVDSTTSDETSEDLMRTLDDLMVKGYEPHLTFERDFVAEGMELLNRY